MVNKLGRGSQLREHQGFVRSHANFRFQSNLNSFAKFSDSTGTHLCDVFTEQCWHVEDFHIPHQHTGQSQEGLAYIAQKWCKIIITSLQSLITVCLKRNRVMHFSLQHIIKTFNKENSLSWTHIYSFAGFVAPLPNHTSSEKAHHDLFQQLPDPFSTLVNGLFGPEMFCLKNTCA